MKLKQYGEEMKLKQYIVTVHHDKGVTRLLVTARNMRGASNQVIKAEKCPRCALSIEVRK